MWTLPPPPPFARRACILVLTDDRRIGEIALALFSADAVVIEASPTVALARVKGDLARAAIVDLDLEDGTLDWMAAARAARPRMPILALASTVSPVVVNRTFFVGASLLCKPCGTDDLATFGRRAFVSRFAPEETVLHAIELFCARAGLSPSQSELVAAAYVGFTPGETSAVVGRAEATVRQGLQDALQRAGHPSVTAARHAIDAILRSAASD